MVTVDCLAWARERREREWILGRSGDRGDRRSAASLSHRRRKKSTMPTSVWTCLFGKTASPSEHRRLRLKIQGVSVPDQLGEEVVGLVRVFPIVVAFMQKCLEATRHVPLHSLRQDVCRNSRHPVSIIARIIGVNSVSSY